MGQTLDWVCKGTEFTKSHWPEEAIPNFYDKCEPAYIVHKHYIRLFINRRKAILLNKPLLFYTYTVGGKHPMV